MAQSDWCCQHCGVVHEFTARRAVSLQKRSPTAMTEEEQAVGWVAVKGRLRFKLAVLQVYDYMYV